MLTRYCICYNLINRNRRVQPNLNKFEPRIIKQDKSKLTENKTNCCLTKHN